MQKNFFYPPSSFNPHNIHSASSYATNNPWPVDPSSTTPVSTAFYSTTSTASWAHKVPTLMPWVTEGNHTSGCSSSSVCSTKTTDPVMRFSAPFPPDPCTSRTATTWELLNNLGGSKTNENIHLKRRTELDDFEVLPNKQCVTEEKMVARMKEMHISNQYTVPLEDSPFGPYGSTLEKAQPARSIQELEMIMSESNASRKIGDTYNRTLVLSPEIKNLVEPEKLFAKAFVNEIQRPTMAVVLWKPPHGSVKDIMDPSSEEQQKDRANDSENNFVSCANQLESNNNSVASTSVGMNGSVTFNSSSFVTGMSSDDDFAMEA